MPAAVAEPSVMRNPAPSIRAAEFVRNLPADFKRAVLVELIVEEIAANPKARTIRLPIPGEEVCVISLDRYFVPVLTAEEEAQIDLAVATPDDCFDPMEMLEQLSRDDRD